MQRRRLIVVFMFSSKLIAFRTKAYNRYSKWIIWIYQLYVLTGIRLINDSSMTLMIIHRSLVQARYLLLINYPFIFTPRWNRVSYDLVRSKEKRKKERKKEIQRLLNLLGIARLLDSTVSLSLSTKGTKLRRRQHHRSETRPVSKVSATVQDTKNIHPGRAPPNAIPTKTFTTWATTDRTVPNPGPITPIIRKRNQLNIPDHTQRDPIQPSLSR